MKPSKNEEKKNKDKIFQSLFFLEILPNLMLMRRTYLENIDQWELTYATSLRSKVALEMRMTSTMMITMTIGLLPQEGCTRDRSLDLDHKCRMVQGRAEWHGPQHSLERLHLDNLNGVPRQVHDWIGLVGFVRAAAEAALDQVPIRAPSTMASIQPIMRVSANSRDMAGGEISETPSPSSADNYPMTWGLPSGRCTRKPGESWSYRMESPSMCWFYHAN